MTEQRRALVVEIMNSEGHIAPTDLVDRVRAKVPNVNASTVYRTLELLEEVGVLSHAHVEGGAEYHHALEHDHVHLVCSNCGTELAVPVEDLSTARAEFRRATGFAPDFTHFAIWGLCEDCGG